MRIIERQFGTARVLDLHGPIVGLAAAEQVDQAICRLISERSILVVNLARVPEMDEHGLLLLRVAARLLRQQGAALRLALPSEPRAPSITRLQSEVECFDAVEDALLDVRAHMVGASLWGRVTRWWGRQTRRVRSVFL